MNYDKFNSSFEKVLSQKINNNSDKRNLLNKYLNNMIDLEFINEGKINWSEIPASQFYELLDLLEIESIDEILDKKSKRNRALDGLWSRGKAKLLQ